MLRHSAKSESLRVDLGMHLLLAGCAAYAIGLLLGGRSLSWDEIEFFRASDAVRLGQIPYRDFYEHHTPLQWFLFAPVTALLDGSGVATVLAMRWAQVPLWIGTLVLLRACMLQYTGNRTVAAIAIALLCSSSAFIHSAVEFRVDSVGTFFFVAFLYLLLRADGRWTTQLLAGLACGLAGLSNLRLGPLLAVAALLGAIYSPAERQWRWNGSLPWMILGAGLAVAPVAAYFASQAALGAAVECLIVDNAAGDAALERDPALFFQRLAKALGTTASSRAGGLWRGLDLDISGLVLLVAGGVGAALGLRRLRDCGPAVVLAVLWITNVLFVMRMKAIYDYHFQTALVLMALLAAAVLAPPERVRLRGAAVAAAVLALVIGAINLNFRGLRAMLAYQDLVMTETDALVPRSEPVWDGVGYALRHPPVRSDLWFYPGLVRVLAHSGRIAPLALDELLSRPPGAIIFNWRMRAWFEDWRAVGAWVIRNYAPYRQHLWLPVPNTLLGAGSGSAEWQCLAAGDYTIVASQALARHPWFAHPLGAASVDGPGKARLEVELSAFGAPLGGELAWTVNGQPVDAASRQLRLQRGDRLTLRWSSLPEAAGLFLVSARIDALFRMAPVGVNLDLPPRFSAPQASEAVDALPVPAWN